MMIANNRLTAGLAVLVLTVLTPGACAFGDTSVEYDYNRDIRPVLSGKCFHCHGPDAAGREADLRLDKRDDARVAILRSFTQAVRTGIAPTQLTRKRFQSFKFQTSRNCS